jgi:hypothetical protein
VREAGIRRDENCARDVRFSQVFEGRPGRRRARSLAEFEFL